MKLIFLASVAEKSIDKLIEHLPSSPKNLKVAFVPTAATPYKDKWFVKLDRDKLEKLGFNLIDVELESKTEKQLTKELEGVDVIFVEGGNTFYLLQEARKSGFDKIVKKLMEKGVVYIGYSAGSVLACPTIYIIRSIDDPTKAPELKSYDGMSLVDFIVLPHFGEKEYKSKYEQMRPEIEKLKYKVFKLNDNQAVLVKGNKIEVVN